MTNDLGELGGRLEGAVERFRLQRRVPGIAAGVVIGQDLAWSTAVGLADLEHAVPVRPDTLFRVASITKTLVATAVAQLRDEGRLSFDDPVVRHVPEFAQVRNPFGPVEAVTLRGLLTHTSGLQYVCAPAPAGQPQGTIEGFVGRDAMLAGLAASAVVIPPGRWKYSNLAYELLGEVIRRVTGGSLSGYLAANVTGPLGMTDTAFDDDGSSGRRRATGYRSTSLHDLVEPAGAWSDDWTRAAGGLWSTVGDLAAWVAQQLRTGAGDRRGPGQVLDGPTLAELHRPTVLKDATWSYAQGLGWAALRRGELAVTSHSGGLPGWRANVLFSSSDEYGVIVLANAHCDAPGLGLELASMVAGVARDRQAERRSHAVPTPPPAELLEYLGTYVIPNDDSVLRVEYRSGGLVTVSHPVLALPGAWDVDELVPTGDPDVWFMPGGDCAGENATFRRDASGRIVAFVMGGETHLRYGPVGQA